MLGLMSDFPLLLHRIIDHAAKFHGERKVITRSVEGPIVETNYAQVRARSLKVAQRLERDGIKLGDRVATLAWNTWRHLESWYGILGIGAIYHTVNPRLFPEQIAYIAAKLGGTFKWDPVNERFPASAEANRLLSRPLRGPWKL